MRHNHRGQPVLVAKQLESTELGSMHATQPAASGVTSGGSQHDEHRNAHCVPTGVHQRRRRVCSRNSHALVLVRLPELHRRQRVQCAQAVPERVPAGNGGVPARDRHVHPQHDSVC